MTKEILTFGDNEIEKHNIHCYENPTFLEYMNIDKILVSNKISFGKRNYEYFIG